MHIAMNFASAPARKPRPASFAMTQFGTAARHDAPSSADRDVDLLWQCLLSGQMDDAARDREMAANPRFRDHVLRMERAGCRF